MENSILVIACANGTKFMFSLLSQLAQRNSLMALKIIAIRFMRNCPFQKIRAKAIFCLAHYNAFLSVRDQEEIASHPSIPADVPVRVYC